jgi:NAD(P)-dependent dehydrogenase (short-subunit alcohol dehydrogenase family)
MTDRPRALVTGGTRGIGRATVLELARAGFDVAFTGRTQTEGQGKEIAPDGGVTVLPGSLDNTQAALAEMGVTGLPIQMDLLDPRSVDETVARVLKAWGGIDLLVNNAFYESGKYSSAWIKDIPLEEFARKMQANFFAPLALIKGFLPGMVERRKGCVINLSTRHNYTRQGAPPGEGSASVCYNCSKAAEGKLADGLAAEHGRDGVLSFDLDPGPVLTERGERQMERLGFPREIFCPIEVPAKAVLWLATDPEAAQYNGQHFMAQELVLQKGLHPRWNTILPMSETWHPGAELDWVPAKKPITVAGLMAESGIG